MNTIELLTIFLMGGQTACLLAEAVVFILKSSHTHPYRLASAIAMIGWVTVVGLHFHELTHQCAPDSLFKYVGYFANFILIPLMFNIAYTLIRRSNSSYWLVLVSEIPFLVLMLLLGRFDKQVLLSIAAVYAAIYTIFMLVWFVVNVHTYSKRLNNAYADIDYHKISSFRSQGYIMLVWAVAFSIDFMLANPVASLCYYVVSLILWMCFVKSVMQQRKVDMGLLASTEDSGAIWGDLDGNDDGGEVSHRAKSVEEIKLSLERCMEQDKLYTNPNLDVRMLSNAVGTSVGTLISYINHSKGQTFDFFVNSYRLRMVVQRIKAEPNVSLEKLARECGFHSAKVMSSRFKETVGMPIHEFVRQKNLNQ